MDDLKALVDELKLVSAGDEFYGERQGQPLILTYLNSSLLGLMFQIPLNTKDQKNLQVPKSLSEREEIKISCENGYSWLSIYNILDYSVEEVINLLDMFLQALVDNHISLDEKCSVCRGNDDANVYYTEGKITRICDKCAELVKQRLIEKEKKLGRRKYIYGVLVPVAVLVLAAGWTLLWLAYDWSFSLSDTDSLDIEEVSMMITSAIAGIILGLPAAFLLKKLYIRNNKLLSVISFVVVATGCLVGEVLYLTVYIFKYYRVIAFRAAVESVKLYWHESAEGMIIMKVVIVFSATIIIAIVARVRKPEIEL